MKGNVYDFKAEPFSYNLEFDGRITLVGGDSGHWEIK